MVVASKEEGGDKDRVVEWRDQESSMMRNGFENDEVLDQREGERIDQNE